MAGRAKGLCLAGYVMGLGLICGACAPVENGGGTTERRAGALAAGDPGDLDILFMIDNSSSMTSMQMKMLTQDPSFMKVLEQFPNGLPNIHVAVVSSDLGAPGDQTTSIGCSAQGDGGRFQAQPQGSCTSTTLASGATFISNVKGNANYTGNLEDVFSCIANLGSNGCGFEHQLASVARALGADGAPPPPENAGFLRPNAELAIVLLTNEDDCSAPANTTLFSLNGGGQNLANPLGPIANYRCNQFGHLCTDPTSATPTALIAPPLNPPADAMGGTAAPTLDLTNCQSNETGSSMLTSVASLVAGIRALKTNPDDQIVVGAFSPPVTPYTVAWVPASQAGGELWPQLEHSCGQANSSDVNPKATQLTTDGSFGDPGVRVAQWVHAFGANGVVASICDADYGLAFQAIADKIQTHLQPSSDTGAGGAGGAGVGGGAGGAGTAGATGTAGHAGGAGGAATMTGAGGVGGVAGSGVAGSAGGAAGHSGGGAGGLPAVGGASGAAGRAGAGGTNAAGATGNLGGASGIAGAPGGANGNAGASGLAGASGTGTGGSVGGGGATATGGSVGTGGTPATGGSHAGGTSGAAGRGSTTNAASSGCGCETASGSSGTSALGLLALAFGLVGRRRGPRRRGRSDAA